LLVGSVILLAGIIGMIISYSANKGLPFVPTYEVKVGVPDAAELVAGSSEVRAGGARVGLVKEVDAVPAHGKTPAYARLTLALDKGTRHLPLDSTVQVRPRSILGAKYVDLRFGKKLRTVPVGGELPLSQGRPVVELDEAFNAFDPETTRGIQRSVTALGNGFAGRGTQLNEAVGALGTLIPGLERVLAVVIQPGTDLAGFLQNAGRIARALVPVAPQLGSLFDSGATTLAAIDSAGSALGDSIAELPATEDVGTRALDRIDPVLADAAAIAREIRPGTRVLPSASRSLDRALVATTPVLKRTHGLTTQLSTTLSAFDRLARDKAFGSKLSELIPLTGHLGSALSVLAPAQTQCNILGLWTRNINSTISEGDSAGSWLRFAPMLGLTQMFQSASPASDLHVNLTPHENASECEAGNEPYSAGQAIGNPPGNQRRTVPLTTRPGGVG
jgi:virulence factor Mce-like protein